jgi:hypothetical protein
LSDPKNWNVKAVRLLMRAMDFAMIFLTTGTTFVAITNPRIPPFFGYFLCRVAIDFQVLGDPCRIRDEFNIQNFKLTMIGDITAIFGILSGCICLPIYMTGLHTGHFIATYEVLPSLIFQKDCLSQFKAEITRAKCIDYTKTLKKYKQLQLLNIMFNEIYRNNFFAMVMVSSTMIMIPSGYLLITSYHINQMILFALLFITVMEYAIFTTMFTMASKVWNSSVKFRYAWRTNTWLGSRPIPRRYRASLQNLQIKIGSSNFFEKNTPFIFLSFCIEQTVTLLLLNHF